MPPLRPNANPGPNARSLHDRARSLLAGGRRAVGWALALAVLAWTLVPMEVEAAYSPSSHAPPEPLQEFRGVWVASVKNIDWPSRPGLSVAQQQAELTAILDAAVQTRLNAVVLQVRTACDALYASPLEPWSEYLTGRMGQAPEPFYDPLAYAISEAHRRGLELHAWFNPYRARHQSAFSPVSRGHISRARPSLVRTYGNQLWLDPGDREVQDYSLRVVLDVVARYDIDGVHFDDYFYPYPEKDARQQAIPFPDWSTWNAYKEKGGTLARDDWRRENVNSFLRRVASAIKERKPWVKFGLSPFGIWRPGHPQGVTGLDAYAVLYADSRRWLAEGVCDYLAPQLYWSTDRVGQSYPVLLGWWATLPSRNCHVWPGLAHSNGPSEVANQIRLSRQHLAIDGHLHWSMKNILQDRNGATQAIKREVYPAPALPPAYPWLRSPAIPRPAVSAAVEPAGMLRFSWTTPPNGMAPVARWVVQRRQGNRWFLDTLPGYVQSFRLPGSQAPEMIAVRAQDRSGQLGPFVTLQRNAPALPASSPGPLPQPTGSPGARSGGVGTQPASAPVRPPTP